MNKNEQEKEIELSLKKIKRRAFFSFLVFGMGSAAGITGWNYLKRQPKALGIIKPLRNALCINEKIPIDDKKTKDFISSKGQVWTDIIEDLIAYGLIYKTIDGKQVRLLTRHSLIGIDKKGRFFAGENISGRVTRWAIKNS